MSTKQAAFLAFIGTVLVAAVTVWHLVFNVVSVARGLVPADVIPISLIYTFGACCVALFFFAYHRQLK